MQSPALFPRCAQIHSQTGLTWYMGWEPSKSSYIGDIVTMWKGFITMSDHRLPKHFFVGTCPTDTWTRQIERIFEEAGFQYTYRNKLRWNIEQIQIIHFEACKYKWASEPLCKPKLQTYFYGPAVSFIKDCVKTLFKVNVWPKGENGVRQKNFYIIKQTKIKYKIFIYNIYI